jgi:lipopolysaccharide cholinephosphotransferase
LRYSLGGGTLLGAVRHKGYIPWDDDIDIMLPRPDYDYFTESFNKTNSHYQVQYYGNDETYPKVFGKIVDQRTVLHEFNTTTGVFIDIFPIDGLPNKDEIGTYMEKYKKLRDAVIRTSRFYKKVESKQRLYRYARYVINRLRTPKHSKAIANFQRFLTSYPFESSPCAGAITGAYAEKEIMDPTVFKSYINISFEGHTYRCIAQYDTYLTNLYGDYMKLPPIEERQTHHVFKAYWK